MRSNFLIVALTLVLLCSLGGCNWNTAGTFDDDNRLTASDRSAMERNGVHDGNGYTDWDRNGIRDDIGDAGERAKNGINDTTRDITNGVRNATRDAGNALENAAR